jgi:hypothetical protein
MTAEIDTSATQPTITHSKYRTSIARRNAAAIAWPPSMIVTAKSLSDDAIWHGVASGLLRGACHRARIRASRWLAMTLPVPVPRDRHCEERERRSNPYFSVDNELLRFWWQWRKIRTLKPVTQSPECV